MKQEVENLMASEMNEFVSQKKKFKVELKNFSTFPPRVIFLNVKENKILSQLKDELENFMIDADLVNIKKEKRPFNPHITIANRDLKKDDFLHAWQYFREKKYSSSFRVTGIALLKNSNGWQVNKTAAFAT
jgi:2'-5' RNA ligase